MPENTSSPSQKGRIFISYRRIDSAGYAGRIYDRLVAYFGEDAIFMDVDTIEGGTDFIKILEDAVQSCDVLIALIGRQWLSITDKDGKRRLDNPEDFVRIEIATALKRNIRVIPVLVDGVDMPQPIELPENLKVLARRNALQVNHHSFNPDVYRLVEHLEAALGEAEKSRVAMKAQALQAAREKAEKEAAEKARLEAEELTRQKAAKEKAEHKAVEITNHSLKVFLCHAHADRDPVRGLYTRLTKDGVDAWLDKAKLLPGQDWELEIRRAVREADVVVVCLSKQFNQAGFRQKEVRLALDTAMEKPEGEIFIIPARLEECDNLESLKKWHWVDLFEDDGYEMLMRALRVRANKIGALDLPIKRTLMTNGKIIPTKTLDMSSLKIMVTGGRVVSRNVEKAAFVIGNQVITRGHVLISNGASGADRASAEGALKACKENSLSPENLIKVYRPSEDPTADFNFGNLHIAGKTYNQRRDYVLEISDVVIVLGGGSGTRKFINRTLNMGKPLIPIGIGDPTEAACDVWQKMFTGFIESPIEIEDLKKIGHKQNQDTEILAVNALILAENLVVG